MVNAHAPVRVPLSYLRNRNRPIAKATGP